MEQLQQQQLIEKMRTIINDTENEKCAICGHMFFDTVSIIKRISAIISPTGEEVIQPIQILICNSCGNVRPEYSQFMQ